MDKIYTAQEMREEAKLFEVRGGSSVIADMLRQAADALEHTKKRTKKSYEYGVRSGFGIVKTSSKSDAIHDWEWSGRYGKIVRREVGTWKVVKE